MALKRLIAKLEDVPEALRTEYKPAADGSGFVLDTDEKDYKNKIDNFDKKAKEQAQQLADLTAKFDALGVNDPEELKRLRKLSDDLDKDEDGKLIKEGKHEQVWEKRRASIVKDYDKKLKTESERATKAEERANKVLPRLRSLTLDTQVGRALGTVGALRGESAKVDALLRAQQVFDVNDDGEIILRDGVELFGKDATKPITVVEWCEKLVDDAPHLWEPSQGGGAKGNPAPRTQGGVERVNHGDPFAMGAAAKKIAEGKAIVV